MGLGNLPAQDQPNSCALRFRGEERDKQVGSIGEARSIVFYGYLQICRNLFPANADTPAGFLCRIDCVSQQVNQELVELIAIRIDQHSRSGLNSNRHTRFEAGNAKNPFVHIKRLTVWRGQACQTRIAFHKAA